MKIGIIGSGVVGEATGRGLLGVGHEVIFYDINQLTLDRLAESGLVVGDLGEMSMDRDVYLFSVSTPTEEERINISFLRAAIDNLALQVKERRRKSYFVVCVRSTVVPGTCENDLIPTFEKRSGKKAGNDFGFCMNPEYLREARALEDFASPRIVTVGAFDQRSFDALRDVYAPFGRGIFQLSLRSAEFQKYVHNCFNAVKIAYFNEMRQIAETHLGIHDIQQIFAIAAISCEGCWNPTYGMRDFGPFGGSCLPKDTEALASFMRDQYRVRLLMILAAVRQNHFLAEFANGRYPH